MTSDGFVPEHVTIPMDDGVQVHARVVDVASARGVVLYLHGIQSHGGWFEQSAEALAKAGFAVLMPDRRGSGRNEHDRGHVRHCRRWFDDLDCHVAYARQRWGYDRVHVVGVSWGGKLAGAYCGYCREAVASLTLVAPGLYPLVDVSGLTKLYIVWHGIMGSRKPFDIPLNEPALFTSNPQRRQFIADDPLRLMSVTGRFLLMSRRLDVLAARGLLSAVVPVGFFLAGCDRIIHTGRTQRLADSMQQDGVAVECCVYDQAAHTLEFESDNRTYLRDLVAWVGQCAGQ